MNILPVNCGPDTKANSFKSVYPVMHWVTENGRKYSPVTNFPMNKKLQGQIVRALNKATENTTKPVDVVKQRLKAFIGSCDVDYRLDSVVRSFYNRVEGSIGDIKPVTYLITGGDVAHFEDYLAKDIGIAKGIAKEITGKAHSLESEMAVDSYNNKGLSYVNNPFNRLKGPDGKTYVLHTKFKIIRNSKGKVKEYELEDAKFLPENGPENPLERLGYCKKAN